MIRKWSFAIIILLASSCIKKHTNTRKVCNNLYVEIFLINPAGVSSHYLTDSSHFRIFTGNVDNDHENLVYSCSNDSIIIDKAMEVDLSGKWPIVGSRVMSLEELRKLNNY